MSVTTLGKERHKMIMELKGRGLIQAQIAGPMHIRESTVFRHLRGLCKCVNGTEADAAAGTSRQAQG